MNQAAPNEVTVVVERDFSVAPEKLWRALTQPQLLAEWLMQNDFQPTVGHRFTLRGEWGGVLDCQVLEIEPLRILAYSWDYPNDDPKFDLKSVVTFTLTATAGGTHLRVAQRGFRPEQKQASSGARIGWNSFFDKLTTLLAVASESSQ